MNLRWYQKDKIRRKNFLKNELNKYLLKSLTRNRTKSFNKYAKIYFFRLFWKFHKKTSSISFLRRSCLITHFTKSVSQTFKMVRHQCKFYATNGLLIGLRKASF